MITWTAVTTILALLLNLSTAVPACENPMHPLPTRGSCFSLVTNIWNEARKYPFLYEWSHNPTGFNEMKLPRTWIDMDPYYTYRCAITVDTIEGHDKDADSFSFKDISRIVSNIVNECLIAGPGIRPQVGSELIGFFHRPRVVRVDLYSVRIEDVGRWNGTVMVEVA